MFDLRQFLHNSLVPIEVPKNIILYHCRLAPERFLGLDYSNKIANRPLAHGLRRRIRQNTACIDAKRR
jgi:hypothetical protein